MDSRSCKNIHSFAFIFSRAKCRRGVSPIIATLLLVAIATVGGSTVFAFSQDSFSTTQISGVPKVELVKILGYDARDVGIVKAHDGIEIITKGPDCCGISDGLLKEDERIAIYLQNNSVEQLWFSEIRISGVVYNFTTYTDFPAPFGIGGWKQPNVKPQQGQYVILLGHDGRNDGDLLKFPNPSMQPGEIITILVDLDQTFLVPRDAQFKLTTVEGNIFVSTINMGGSSP